ncbi:MAG: hypothetical protein E2O52_01330 [Gammaproteobacteria bacterium]|nr:MAG: hypothetical protein E2O52_01330 [Gammaproteobacteria bacterium]
MDTKHLDMIVCPVTKSPLQHLDSERLAQMNTAIDAGGVHNHAEQSVSESLGEALVTHDGRVIYPIVDGIPILLEEESIDWNQIVE